LLSVISGTQEDYETALYTKAQFEAYGLQNVRVEAEPVLLNYPASPAARALRVVWPRPFTASLEEDAFASDATSHDPRIVPTFNGYSASGSATARLVYANYGRMQDFQALEAAGVDVRGSVVLVRYGKLFRGLKALLAQRHGALGCIIFSDPLDDGYVAGEVYPNGPWRPEHGVQRGSAAFNSVCPGDPRNPLCSPSGVSNLTHTIPRIPVLPISYGDAEPLLRQLQGPVLNGFQGGLNLTYRAGPGVSPLSPMAVERLY